MEIVVAHQRWQAARRDELAGPESWLGLIGLFWLEPGLNTVGGAEASCVQLPAWPPHLGDLRWQDGRLFWLPETGPEIELQTDLNGPPSTVDYKNWSFFVVDRDHRLAVRLRDRDWASTKPFNGLEYFSYDPAWRIAADWQAYRRRLKWKCPMWPASLKPFWSPTVQFLNGPDILSNYCRCQSVTAKFSSFFVTVAAARKLMGQGVS